MKIRSAVLIGITIATFLASLFAQAGGGPSLSALQLSKLTKMSREDVYKNEDYFIYKKYVYSIKDFRERTELSKDPNIKLHINIFQKRANPPEDYDYPKQEFIEQDIKNHPKVVRLNPETQKEEMVNPLLIFVNNQDNIIGVLVD